MKRLKKTAVYFCYSIISILFLVAYSCKHEDVLGIKDFGDKVPENIQLSNYSNTSVTVKWDSVSQAASYTIELLDSIGSNSPIDQYTTISHTSHKFSDLKDSLDYYVRIRANFNTIKNPILGNWSYLMKEERPARIIPAFGIVDADFKTPKIYSNFPEGFEDILGKRKGSYTSTEPELYSTGEWVMYRSYSTNSGTALLHKVGDFAVMLSPNIEGYVAMDFDLPHGANRLTFVTGSATKTNANDINNMPITLSVFYSIDQGKNWNKIDDILIDDVEKQYVPDYNNLNIHDPVRFKFQKDSGTARPIVDEITVYYTD